jgi:hypothetical protein
MAKLVRMAERLLPAGEAIKEGCPLPWRRPNRFDVGEGRKAEGRTGPEAAIPLPGENSE